MAYATVRYGVTSLDVATYLFTDGPSAVGGLQAQFSPSWVVRFFPTVGLLGLLVGLCRPTRPISHPLRA